MDDLPLDERKTVEIIAAPAAAGIRLPTEETSKIILALCQGRYLTTAALAEIMNRNPVSLRTRFLAQMVTDGLLERKYPKEPNRPDQAYTTAKKVVNPLPRGPS